MKTHFYSGWTIGLPFRIFLNDYYERNYKFMNYNYNLHPLLHLIDICMDIGEKISCCIPVKYNNSSKLSVKGSTTLNEYVSFLSSTTTLPNNL